MSSKRNHIAKELWTPKFRPKVKDKKLREKKPTPGTRWWYEQEGWLGDEDY